jgi:hypothetical protein
MRTSSRQSLTWSAHNAVEECRNSNVKENAAETGLLNGNGRITRRETRCRSVAAMLPGRCAEPASDHLRDCHPEWGLEQCWSRLLDLAIPALTLKWSPPGFVLYAGTNRNGSDNNSIDAINRLYPFARRRHCSVPAESNVARCHQSRENGKPNKVPARRNTVGRSDRRNHKLNVESGSSTKDLAEACGTFCDSPRTCRSPDPVPPRPYSRSVGRPTFIDSSNRATGYFGHHSVSIVLFSHAFYLLFRERQNR